MSNCLVTKLTESVSDTSLPKLGVLRVQLKQGTSDAILSSIYATNSTCILSLVSGNFSIAAYQGDTYDLPFAINNSAAWRTINVGEGGAVIEIADKYALSNLRALESLLASPLNTDDLEYMTHISIIGDGNNYSLVGDIAKLSKLVNLTRLNCRSAGLYGDVAALGAMTSLDTVAIFQTSIAGELIDIVLGQRVAGRTTGSITFTWLDDKITFNGEPCNTSNNTILSWTASTITWNDITITA